MFLVSCYFPCLYWYKMQTYHSYHDTEDEHPFGSEDKGSGNTWPVDQCFLWHQIVKNTELPWVPQATSSRSVVSYLSFQAGERQGTGGYADSVDQMLGHGLGKAYLPELLLQHQLHFNDSSPWLGILGEDPSVLFAPSPLSPS